MPLSQSATRHLGRMLLGKYVKSGFAPTQAINRIRSLGYSYRRTDMFSDYHRFKSSYDKVKYVKEWPVTKRPSKGILTETKLRRARRYRVFGEGFYWNEEKEEYLKKTISWYTDTSGSVQDMIDDFLDKQARVSYEKAKVPVSVDVFEIQHNKGMYY